MHHLLALEWDSSEARMVVASASRGGTATIEQAFSVTLRSSLPGEDAPEVNVGERIAAALAARGIGRPDTLVAVGRSNIELRQLSLPPAPDEELPDMVRFQAMREFNELADDWLLDFVPIDEATEGPRNVLAAAIGPELVGQIQQTCQTAGLRPRRLILRPCAAAALWNRTAAAGGAEPSLLIDLLSDEVDLTVVVGKRVVFLRTTRLGGDPLADPDHRPALLGEIRRTMAAAQNQMGGRPVGSIVLCGRDTPHADLARAIQESLLTPTELLDPFEGLDLSRQLQQALPDHPGRFAPLLGMALAELEQTGHAVDFLHPRRRPVPPSRHATYVLVGALAAALVVLYLVFGRLQKTWLQNEIRSLNVASRELDQKLADMKRVEESVGRIEQWAAGDVGWLDELARLSDRFQPAKEAMLTQLKILPASTGGLMELQGLAGQPDTISAVEKDLRDPSHRVEATGSGADASKKPYSWWFKSSVFVLTKPEKP